MGKDEEPADGQTAQIIKASTPPWKASPTVIKGMIVLAVVAVALIIWKPWKKEEPTSQQTVAASPGSIVTLGQSGGTNTVINQGAIERTITKEKEAEIVNLFRPFWQTHLKNTNAVVYVKVANSLDKEQMAYAERISEVIRSCGIYTIESSKRKNVEVSGRPEFGIELFYDSQHPPAYAVELERVFQAAGIMPPRVLPPVTGNPEGSGVVYLWILGQPTK